MKNMTVKLMLIFVLALVCIAISGSTVNADLVFPSSSATTAPTSTTTLAVSFKSPTTTVAAVTTAVTTPPATKSAELPVTGIEETSWMVAIGIIVLGSGVYAYRKMGDYKGI